MNIAGWFYLHNTSALALTTIICPKQPQPNRLNIHSWQFGRTYQASTHPPNRQPDQHQTRVWSVVWWRRWCTQLALLYTPRLELVSLPEHLARNKRVRIYTHLLKSALSTLTLAGRFSLSFSLSLILLYIYILLCKASVTCVLLLVAIMRLQCIYI